MRLYTSQSLEVVKILMRDGIYKPSFEKCDMLQDVYDRAAFERPYRWLMDQYNKIKQNEFSSAAVWWQTSLKEALRCYKNAATVKTMTSGTNQVLLMADVDNKDILLLDDDLWCDGPFCQYPLWFRGSSLFMSNEWTDKDKELEDKLWKLKETNRLAMEETWKHVFRITKHTRMVHAITPFIYKSWIIPRKKLENQDEFNEM